MSLGTENFVGINNSSALYTVLYKMLTTKHISL